MLLATSSLVVWHGRPSGLFPAGDHVFPADVEASAEFAAALCADLAEVHLVPLSLLAADRPAAWPLRLTSLRAFLARRASRLDEVLCGPSVASNTREHGRGLVARLRELGAPPIIVAHEEAELARVSRPGWRPTLALEALLPDALGAASLVDADSRARPGGPLAVGADISDLVLLASACCVTPGAAEVPGPWPAEQEWTSLLDVERDETPAPHGFVRVRPAVYPDALETLAVAGALLRVVVPVED